MKKLKRSVCIVMAILISLCLNTPVFATTSTDISTVQPNADFIRVCNQLFIGNGEVYDCAGTDITKAFIEKYYLAFQQEDYAMILQACFEEDVSQIHGYANSPQQNAARAVLRPTYEEYVVHLVQQEGFPYDGKAWYLIVTATGTYTYQDSYGGYIVDFPVPTINITFSELGALFSGSLTSITTTTPIINGKTASFSVTTVHTVSCPIPGLDYVTGTLGPFTNVSNFTIQGI